MTAWLRRIVLSGVSGLVRLREAGWIGESDPWCRIGTISRFWRNARPFLIMCRNIPAGCRSGSPWSRMSSTSGSRSMDWHTTANAFGWIG